MPRDWQCLRLLSLLQSWGELEGERKKKRELASCLDVIILVTELMLRIFPCGGAELLGTVQSGSGISGGGPKCQEEYRWQKASAQRAEVGRIPEVGSLPEVMCPVSSHSLVYRLRWQGGALLKSL